MCFWHTRWLYRRLVPFSLHSPTVNGYWKNAHFHNFLAKKIAFFFLGKCEMEVRSSFSRHYWLTNFDDKKYIVAVIELWYIVFVRVNKLSLRLLSCPWTWSLWILEIFVTADEFQMTYLLVSKVTFAAA